ncbi:MAG TPA: glycosyltransferase [Bryobacteraceae bacterium]|nr:glycosyltransferase [Bryobacteraceae bacterium]
MRLAFFSPMPPSVSGIADYSEALLSSMRPLADITVFVDAAAPFDPSKFDLALYHAGNNPHHAFVYETALRHPGVVVMHESSLHHLIADITIRHGDWDAYLREAEYNGGPEALARARRARALEIGPDYEGLPMTRRLLEASRAVIVHSRHMACEVRKAGFRGPIARIPHGAWIPDVDRLAYRQRLGLDETTPLIGVFGHLKPYKRIAESLRAFRRLLRLEPQAKMILGGEPHPDLPVASMIRGHDLSAAVRMLGFVPGEHLAGYISACDIVLNLRYPTVGETSGTLLRALGLGRCVLVSEVGSFAELPDDICLKVPVGSGEEDLLFEYLNLLVSRPEIAQAVGGRAKQWVERECNWDLVARRYAAFLECVHNGSEWTDEDAPAPTPEPEPEVAGPPVDGGYILSWAANEESRAYVETHMTRLEKTLAITPLGGPDDRILEMGAYIQITPALRTKLGYGEVRACYYGQAGEVDEKRVATPEGEVFECKIELFDAEKDTFPYQNDHFSTVLCCELIEHLANDPMHMMAEINRILKPGGHLVLTTPNIASIRGLAAILLGYHPGFFPAYIRPSDGEETEARHNREYSPREVHLLLVDAGFEVVLLETGPFRDEPKPELLWVNHLLERYKLSTELRGDGIYAVGRKTGAIKNRYPAWLYSGHA